MVARHEILNIQVWNADASAAIALTPYVSVDVSARADLSIDTLSIVISDKHPAMQLLRTHRNIPVIVSFAVNGIELSGLVTALKQTKDGEVTVTVSGDTKHAARMLARARSTSAIDGATAQVEAPVGDLAAQMIGEAAQRTGLPVYILQEHEGDVVQVEISSEDTIADVLAPVLEASDTFIDMRMLFPGEELPGEGDILRVQGRAEFQWEQDRLAAGAWPQAEAHERLKRAAIMPPTTPMPHLSWSGWAEVSETGSSVAKTRGVCWMPFDIGQHDRGYWQEDDNHGVRVASVEQLAEARKAGWFEHVTRWSAGTFGDSNDTALRQAVEAELVVKTDGSKISSVSTALSYIGDAAGYAWFDGTHWVLADEAAYQAEDAARNPNITQLQTPGVLVHIHAGRDRRNEVLFSATDGGGLENWQTTTTSPEAAMIHATTQLSQSTLEALQSGSAAIDPVAGILTSEEASQYVGELPDVVNAIDVNASPFSTVSGTDISRHHLGGAVNINAAGAFFYREMVTSTASNSVNPVAEIGRAYHDAQGSTSIELTPGFTQTSVFGDDVVIDERVIPGWKPGDRVSFTEGITRISEVVAGFELHAAWDTPLRVTPVLSRADNGVLDTLVERLRRAERDAANALQQNPRRVPKDDVDVVVDENETVKDAKQVAETANSAAGFAQRSADGKSTIFYGATAPAKAKAGDTWFKDLADGGTVLMQYVNGKWVEKVNTKAIDDELAANQEALTELNDVALPALRQELEALDTVVAREAAEKLATLETKLANADKALKQDLQAELAALDEALTGDLATSLAGLQEELEALDAVTASDVAAKLATLETKLTNADKALKQGLQGELAALDTALSGELASSLTSLQEELEALDAVTASEVADKLATLETKLANADKALKQGLQGELNALDTALSGELTTSLASLKDELEAADTAAADAVATTLVQLENRLKSADQTLKTELVAQLEDLEADLAALDPIIGEDLTSRLAALRTELKQADTDVRTTLRGEMSTLKTQLQNADVAIQNALTEQLATARKALEDADDAVTNDLTKKLEEARKGLKNASDAIADDLAEVDSVVSRQRPGNLFPDPFFADSSWTGALHVAENGILKLRASGAQSGRYYQPAGLRDSSIQFERGASYLLTADVRFGSTTGITYVDVYARVPKLDGTGIWTPRLGRINRVTVGPNKNSYAWAPTSTILTLPDDIATGTGTIGFFVQSAHPDGDAWLTNVRLTRAADNSLIIDGAVTAAKVKAGVIDTDHIAAGAIVATRLAADSVIAGKIATNAVVAKNIAAEQVTTAKLAADAVTANKIAADQILAKHVKSGQITTAKLAADAVTANEIAADAVTANAIKAGQVTTAKLAADAVTANKVAADAILARNIKSGQITTAKIAADAVTANEIASNQILAKHIKAGEISTAKIGAKQITTDKLAADAVTANQLQAEDATINKLWANGLAAKSVTTNRILVADNGNMLPEISSYVGSDYPNPDPYEAFGKNSGDPSMWLKGRVNAYIYQPIKLVAGQKYRMSYQAKASVNMTSHYLLLRAGDLNGPDSSAVTVRTKVNGASGSSLYLVADGKVGGGWKTFDLTFEALATEIAYLYIYANHSNGTTNPNYQWFKDVRLEKMTGATLIEDGAITTNKIAADAVTANAIKADAVTANAIKSGEVAAKHLAADAVTANKLLAEDATIDKLWANGLVAKTVQTASLSVGAANLYRDPSLLDANSFGARRSDTGGYGGGGSFTVAPSTATSGGYDTLGAATGRPTRLVPGVTYYVSAMVRPDRLVASGNLRLYLRAYPTASATGTQGWASPQFVSNSVSVAGGNWYRIEGTFKMHAEYEYLVMGFYVGSASQAQARYSDPMVIRQHSSTMIADGAITTGKVAARAITADELAADSVTANAIKAGEVTATKIASDAVSATKLLAEDATIDKLWANGIAAKSVLTNSLLVAGNGNMLPEISSYFSGSGYPDPDPYRHFGKNSSHPSMWLQGRVNAYIFHPISLVAGQKYRLSYKATASVNGTSHYLFVREASPGGTVSPSNTIRTKLNGNSSDSLYLVTNGKIGTSWSTFDVTFEPTKTEVAYIYIYANHTNGTSNTNGYQWFRDVRLEKMTGATLIEDGAVTTNKIAADAVTANAIKADAVTSNKIKSGEVAAKHLAAGAVSATKLLAEDATINKLWANGLAAKAITASRLTVSPGNMFPDPNFQDPSWDVSGVTHNEKSISLIANGTQRGVYLQPEGQANASMQHAPGVNYLMTANLRFGGNANITKFSVYARMQRASGVYGATKVGEFVRFPTDGQPHASYRYMDNSTVLNFSPIEMAPGGLFTLGFFVERSETGGNVEIGNVRLTPMSGTTLIENGAVTTDKVAANAITANKIKAGEITSNHISASKISSDKITVKNGFIKNAMIGNAQIESAKIANLDAGKIKSGTIDAKRIGAKTIEGRHLAVDTIEADQIKANAFIQVANSAIPLYPGTTKPAWTINADATGLNSNINEGDSRWYRFSSTKQPGSDNFVEVDPDIEYVFSVWIHGTTGSVIYLELRDQDDNHAVASGGISSYSRNNAANYLLQNFTITGGWRKISTKIKLKPEARFVRIGGIYGNHSNGVNGSAYLADMQLYPDVASQTEVDARQDDAIKKMQDYVDELTGIFYSQSAAYAKKFNELSEPMSGGLLPGQDEPGIMTTTKNKITCTPGWVGHILVHATRDGTSSSANSYLEVKRHEVTGSSREFSLPTGYSYLGGTAIHWFRRPGRARATDMSRGAYAMPSAAWTTVSTATVGTGEWNLSATVGWDSANNHGAYGIRILVNGSEVARVAPRTGLGPLLPIGSGYRTQSLSASGNGNGRSTKFEIQAYIGQGTTGQRRIRKVTATLDWTKLN